MSLSGMVVVLASAPRSRALFDAVNRHGRPAAPRAHPPRGEVPGGTGMGGLCFARPRSARVPWLHAAAPAVTAAVRPRPGDAGLPGTRYRTHAGSGYS